MLLRMRKHENFFQFFFLDAILIFCTVFDLLEYFSICLNISQDRRMATGKGPVLLRQVISLNVICVKVKFSKCDFCNIFHDCKWTYM